MLELRAVSRSWNGFGLKNINIQVARGEYFMLLGPSGSGKTLLLSTISGIYFPDRGKILLKDKDITYVPPEKRRIGYVFQKNYLFPHLSVKKNITYGMGYHGFTKTEMTNTLKSLNKLLELSSLINRDDTPCLSGGEAQKIALARALAIKPDILLLDEPMSSLDYDNRNNVIETLKRINKELKLTTIHVTHDITEVRSLAHRTVTIKNGGIVSYEHRTT
ncbi:MAG: ATP-binding cassette domain-containing protein [Candidatus Omnitrophica bacterium]|nr:ATP-binding cassette domain-containing protein [Candidatus Omnitrophota bacterium]